MRRILAEGISACPGRVRGRAAVILPGSRSDFQRGDVLVMPSMLFGDWLVYIQQAAAVVTDRGGRRSHAAVAACELGIPCIVGTRNGTAAIRPGMDVLVDATRGQVIYEEE
ncbi:MAG: PEP-utilizing enzyme [Pseudomonadota bacterium]